MINREAMPPRRKDSEDLLRHIREQVSGIPVDSIPKWKQLKPENLEEGIRKFLRKNPNPFGVNE